MPLKRIRQNNPRSLLYIIRLVHHVRFQLHDRRRIDRLLFQHPGQFLDGLFKVGLVVFEDLGRVAFLQATKGTETMSASRPSRAWVELEITH